MTKDNNIEASLDSGLVERVARAIEPETFNLPRINLNKPVFERAYSRSRAAIAALQADRTARERVLEEAATVAERTKAYDDHLQQSTGCSTTGQRIAAAIRALKETTQ